MLRQTRAFSTAVIALLLCGTFSACKHFGIRKVGIDLGRMGGSDKPRPRRKHPGRGHGPPDHAPAHGRRAQERDYHYFPDADVYYDDGAEIYFYLEDGEWRMEAKLPRRLRVRLGDYVEITVEGDNKPYVHHKKHKRKYPPGQRKKRKKRKKHKWKDW